MAEHVQNAMLSMSSEFEIMKEHLNHRFSDSEIKMLREKCRNYEYKIKSFHRCLEDYRNYVKFLDNFLSMVQKLYENEKTKRAEVKSVKNLVHKRFCRIYDEMLKHFGYNFDVCVEYYNRFYDDEKRLRMQGCINRLIESHSTNEQSWLLAAKWLEKHCGDHKKAQEYLCSGLKSCLSRNLLYKAAVKYELEHINKLNLNREQMAMEAAKIQTTYLEDIFEKNKDFNFYIELVELLSEYNFGGTLIDFVYQQLEKEYAKQPKTVWCLAQRAINKDIKSEKLVKECVQIYKDGFAMMEDKEKKVELTDLFLDHILKWKQDKLFGFQFINEYMQMAHDSSLLLERHYICWLHLCDDDDKIALTVLMKGVETNPESIRLWKLRLYYGIERSMPNEDVQQIFENGVAHLKEKALPLWNAFLRFTILEESAANLEPIQTINIFKKAMAQPEEISRPFKIKYLEWAIVHRNIEEVRKIYEEISQNPPYVKELYSCMVNCELVACKKEGKVGFDKCKDLENLENIHKRACQQFESDADVWLNYMNFVKTHTEKDEILVFNQATRKLKGIQLIHFKHKCGVFNKELN